MIRQRSYLPSSPAASSARKRRNRNRRNFAVILNGPKKFVLGLVIAVIALAAGLCQNHQKSICLGRQISELEQQEKQLMIECEHERLNWAAMISPDKFDQAMLRHGIAMHLPSTDQMVHVAVDYAKPLEYHASEWAVAQAAQ